MLGIVMLVIYMVAGMAIMRWQLPTKRPFVRAWLGCSLGLLLMMWLPALFAFALRFSVAAHGAAIGLLALIAAGAWLARDKRGPARWAQEDHSMLLLWLCIALPLCVLGGYLQLTHVLRPAADGSLHVGQATYGDLNLHLGIATSLRDAAFPPDYSILPGARLSYPFLGDSLSTSFLLFGLPLRWAIIVPGTLMMALVFTGYLLLARSLLGKRHMVLVLAVLLFFLNGGLGFLYSFDMAGKDPARIAEIFTGFYKTPTNQPDLNLRWSNVIADLLLPQRTLLAGWALLLPALYLLYSSMQTRKKRQFLLTALFAGGLPLVHTHSFLALGLCSGGWLLCGLVQAWGPWRGRKKTRAASQTKPVLWGAVVLCGLANLAVMAVFFLQLRGDALRTALAGSAPPNLWLRWLPAQALLLCGAGWLLCAFYKAWRHQRPCGCLGEAGQRRGGFYGLSLCGLVYLWIVLSLPLWGDFVFGQTAYGMPYALFHRAFIPAHMLCAGGWALCALGYVGHAGRSGLAAAVDKRRVFWALLWGALLYLVMTLTLALPQLIDFAFKQTLEGNVLRFQFNWVNNSQNRGMIDGYFWFWIKNVGPGFLLLLCAVLDANARRRLLASGAFAIFVVTELLLFQRNEYDNNKLFYVWYMIGAMLAADYAGVLWRRLAGLRGRWVLGAAFLVAALASGSLSIAREAVSDYQLFSAGAVACAEYVDAETPRDAMFLTGEQHVNPVSALAGRRIVCGPDLYLYFHGLDYMENRNDIDRFYTDPANNLDVLDKYGVDYILLGEYERSDYGITGTALDALFPVVYEQGDHAIYRVVGAGR